MPIYVMLSRASRSRSPRRSTRIETLPALAIDQFIRTLR